MKSNELFWAMRSYGTATRFTLGVFFAGFLLSLFVTYPVAADDLFTGTWQSKRSAGAGRQTPLAGDFDLQLSQTGKLVSGSYLNGEGRITGLVSGGALRFNWQDEFGVGTGTFHISKDGKTLIGSWSGRTASLRSIRGTWSATRLGHLRIVGAPGGNAEVDAKPSRPVKSIGGKKHFSGTWITETSSGGNFEMVLEWFGNERVTGTFTGGGSSGTISGILFDNVLHFSWSQDGGKYRGAGKFVLADDGKSFTGTYGNNPQNPNDTSAGSWNGRRK